MAWDGSGGFDRLYNWVTDKAGGIKIRADRMDGEFDNYATGLENCITRDGQNSPTANLPMGTFKHTNVAASSARTDYARVAEIQDGTHFGGIGGGSANTHTLTLSPAITAYAAKQRFIFLPTAANTAAATINVNGVGAKSIKMMDGADIYPGALSASVYADIVYDGTNFILLNPANAQNEILLASTSASASSSIDFVDHLDNTFYEYRIDFYEVLAASSSQSLQITFSANSGGAWDIAVSVTAATVPVSGLIKAHGSVRILNARPNSNKIYMPDCFAGSHYTTATLSPGTGIADSLRMIMSSGNITSGEFFLYGVNKS